MSPGPAGRVSGSAYARRPTSVGVDALAEVVVVTAALTLLEENRHAFGHVNAEKLVEVGNERSRRREDDGLSDAVAREMLAPERCDLEVVLDDKGSIETLQTQRG